MLEPNQSSYTVRGAVLGDGKPVDIAVQNGRIASMTPASGSKGVIGSKRTLIGPSLFDIQVNGAGGIDLQDRRLKPEDVARLNDWLGAHGVSYWIPTLITGSQKHLERACRVLAEVLQDKSLARCIPGIHLEGPYISPLDGPRGAHPKRHVRKPSLKEFDQLSAAAGGKIVYVTLAPEVDGAVPFIQELTKRRITVSLGHHQADAEQIRRAVDAGAQLSTHLGNGLAAAIPRHQNPLWPQLAEDRLTASFIADLEHLPGEALKTFIRAKGPARTILTSDAVHLAGLKPGHYELAGQPVELGYGGRITLKGTDFLAGSSLMLLQGVVNAARVTDLTLEQAFESATTIPAQLFKVKRRFPRPEVGKRADFTVFDIDMAQPEWQVRMHGAFINGAFKKFAE